MTYNIQSNFGKEQDWSMNISWPPDLLGSYSDKCGTSLQLINRLKKREPRNKSHVDGKSSFDKGAPEIQKGSKGIWMSSISERVIQYPKGIGMSSVNDPEKVDSHMEIINFKHYLVPYTKLNSGYIIN